MTTKQEKVEFVANYLMYGGSPFRKLPKHKFTRILGAGTYGAALEMKKNNSKDQVVVKISDPKRPDEFNNEVTILQKFQEKCVAQNLPCFRAQLNFPAINAYAMNSNSNAIQFHVFYEQLMYNTRSTVNVQHYIETLDYFFGSVCNTLDYIHSLGIAHNDIKTDNIIIERKRDGTLIPILIDFGISLIKNSAGKTECYYYPRSDDTYRPLAQKYYGKNVNFELSKRADFFMLRRTFLQPDSSRYLNPCMPVYHLLPDVLKTLFVVTGKTTEKQWNQFHITRKQRYPKNMPRLNCSNKYYKAVIYSSKLPLANTVSMEIDSA